MSESDLGKGRVTTGAKQAKICVTNFLTATPKRRILWDNSAHHPHSITHLRPAKLAVQHGLGLLSERRDWTDSLDTHHTFGYGKNMKPRGNANVIDRSAKSRTLINCKRFRVEAGDSWWGQAVCLSTNPA